MLLRIQYTRSKLYLFSIFSIFLNIIYKYYYNCKVHDTLLVFGRERIYFGVDQTDFSHRWARLHPRGNITIIEGYQLPHCNETQPSIKLQ